MQTISKSNQSVSVVSCVVFWATQEITDTECDFLDNVGVQEGNTTDKMPGTSEHAMLLEQLQCTLRIQTIARVVQAV